MTVAMHHNTDPTYHLALAHELFDLALEGNLDKFAQQLARNSADTALNLAFAMTHSFSEDDSL